MALKLITPAAAIVSLQEAKRHCRAADFDDDDAYLTSLVDVATSWIDGKDGWLGRSIGTQTWDYVLDRFPCASRKSTSKNDGIRIPLPPLQSITSVFYVDPDTETEATLATDQYEVDTFSEPGWVMPGTDGWPSTLDTINAVRIRFVAGYATAPTPIKHAILLLVGNWYENRESVLIDQQRPNDLPFAVDALLMPYRSWGF